MISVVIPVYNVQEYLIECVSSVLNLKADIEVILVDDGSTDNSGVICDELAATDERINVVHRTNGGLSAARNTGIEAAMGEFIMFVDSDDFIDPEETDIFLMKLNNQIDVALGLYRNYYHEGHRFEKEKCDALLSVEGIIPTEVFLAVIPSDGRESYMTAWRFVVRREFLLKYDLFFMPGLYHEDEEWTHRMFSAMDKILVTHHYFYQYRQARQGAITSGVKPKHIYDTFVIIERAQTLINDQQLDDIRLQYLKNRMGNLYLNCLIHFFSLDRENRQNSYKQLCYFKSSCVQHLSGRIGCVVKLSVNSIGVLPTCLLLNLLRILKK